MVSSIIVGSVTDKTRSYFMVTLVLLVLGVFALAECGVSLDDDRDGDVRWSMLIVSGLLGPLLPVATELAVELAYPLSENTVLVILQLSCNLLSALFRKMLFSDKHVYFLYSICCIFCHVQWEIFEIGGRVSKEARYEH